MPPPKKKSILFIVDKIFPTDEIFVEEIYAKMIPSRGYNVSFVIRKDENILSAPKKWHGNKIFFVSNEMSTSNPIKKIYKLCNSAFQIYKVIKNDNFDIVQIRNWPWALLVTSKLKSIFSYKLVFQRSYPINALRKETIKKMTGIKRILQTLRNNYWHKKTINLMQYCDAIFPVSEEMKSVMEKEGVSEKLMIPIPYGCTDPPIVYDNEVEDLRKKYQLIGKEIILYFGASEPVRRIELLIDAFEKVYKKCNNTHLILLGGNLEEKKRLSNYAINKQMDSIVTIIGKVPRNELDKYISLSLFTLSILPPLDVYMVCTPGKLIDSLLNARAVVGNKLPFQEKLINKSKAGLCVDYSVETISKTMIWMINNKQETITMGQKGKSYIIKNWSFNSLVDKMEKTYLSFA